jgi:transposase
MKRHLAVDSNGLPHAVHVTTANVTDRTGAVAMVMKEQGHLVQVERVLVDAGYTGKPFAEAIQATIGAAVEVVKRSELHTFKLMPKRRVVERSFSWLEKCRRLWKNCEHTLTTSLQMMVLAFVVLLLRRL